MNISITNNFKTIYYFDNGEVLERPLFFSEEVCNSIGEKPDSIHVPFSIKQYETWVRKTLPKLLKPSGHSTIVEKYCHTEPITQEHS